MFFERRERKSDSVRSFFEKLGDVHELVLVQMADENERAGRQYIMFIHLKDYVAGANKNEKHLVQTIKAGWDARRRGSSTNGR